MMLKHHLLNTINKKQIELCADDFGLNNGISGGIIDLAKKGRLSAVSCMANGPVFKDHAAQLLSISSIKIGLHFNLTQGNFLSQTQKTCFSLNELLVKSHLGAVNCSSIAEEFLQQLQQFRLVIGHDPDFVDGHQHVHQFPIIRKVLFDLYETELRKHHVTVRSTYPMLVSPRYYLKKNILAYSGGKSLKKMLNIKNIPHNLYFSGIYNFDKRANYRMLFRQFLAKSYNHTLIMCHPGYRDSSQDAIQEARKNEMNYFSSSDFLDDCEEYRIHLIKKPT